MLAVTDLSALGWTPGRAAELTAGCTPARVSRVDRGRLTVLTADGETRLHPVAALYDESGLSGPAVGDRVAVRGELAVAVLPWTSAFVRGSSGRVDAARGLRRRRGCAPSTGRSGSSPTGSASSPVGHR
jgi:ribosome biogenesis GTPase